MYDRSSNVDIGRRDPDYSHRPALPWRNKGIENYTVCCPRCGSYKLADIHFVTIDGSDAFGSFRCSACSFRGHIAFLSTRHGLMLATD